MSSPKSKKRKASKTRHSNRFVKRLNEPLFRRNFIIASIISLAGVVYTAFAINNTSSIATTLPETYTITGNSIDLNLSSVIELPSSGWSDSSDRISIEVSITNGSADDAIVDRSTDGCAIDISSSTSSNSFGTTQANGAFNYDGDNADNVFTFNDRTAQLTLLGLASEVKEAIGKIRASCNTQALFAGKYIRVGAVPTIGSGTGAAACGDANVSCENLYYLFSTQHYYRVSNTSQRSAGTQGIIDIWNTAKAITIPVDGTNKTGGNRRGFVATLATRDELILTDAIRGSNIQMIGTTDLTGSFTYDTNWGGSGTSCATDEGTFSWLGPDRWCNLIPTWNRSGNNEWSPNQQTSGTNPNNEESRYWSRDSSGVWSRGTASSFTIDLGSSTIPTTEDQSGTHNGYNFFHGWHSNTTPDEPNSSGDYIYLGYGGSGGNPGWDDAYPGNGAGRDQINSNTISGYFIQEFCNPNQSCAPDANAVDSAQFKIAQTITFSGAANLYVSTPINLTAATTTSGLTISYSTNDSNICTVNSSAVVTVVSRGTCTVTAAQAGDTDYLAATSVSQTFLTGLPSMTWTSPAISAPGAGVSTECTKTDSTDGNYQVTVITAGSSCRWSPPSAVTSIETLVIGGGGGGGTNRGGGGGAGGFVKTTIGTLASNLRITVGSGGTGADNDRGGTFQTNGGDSILINGSTTITAIGGGFGGGGNGATNTGANGGSGGGAGFNYSTNTWTGGTATSGQGNNGANSGPSNDANRYTGGGGGAGGAGVTGAGGNNSATGGTTPNGGIGIASLISGTSAYYAGGGGGAMGLGNGESGGSYTTSAAGVGGLGGGGNGGGYNQVGSAATANTGGGGGGGAAAANTDGGNGGSGVVILRYSRDARFDAGSYTPEVEMNSNTVSNNGTLVAQSATYTGSSDTCGTTWTNLSSSSSYALASTNCYRFTYDPAVANSAVAPTSSSGIAVTTNLTSPVLKPGLPKIVWTNPSISTPSAGTTSDCTKTDSTSDSYRITTITSGSSCSWTPPSGVSGIEVFAVAGGGGGGTDRGGGGGAGGILKTSIANLASSISVTVGSGGNGATYGSNSRTQENGSNSQIVNGSSTITATGGGYGGGINGADSRNGNSGGSGGGVGFNFLANSWSGGSGTSGQGNSGANSASNNDAIRNTGGGGGAGSAGISGSGGSTSAVGGTTPDGGRGFLSNITGTPTFFAGGGGGSVGLGTGELAGSYTSAAAGFGGFGGGGAGAGYNQAGLSGAANTGGGGGGGAGTTGTNGGSGGSGIVILKYSSDIRVAQSTFFQPSLTETGLSNFGTIKIQTATYTISTDTCGTFGNTSSTTNVTIEGGKCYRWTYDPNVATGAGAPFSTNSISVDTSLTSPIVKPITVPAAPTSVTASISGSTTTVSWTAPTNDGGATITGYVIQVSRDSGTWETLTDSDGNATNTSATFEDLDNGSLVFRVAATNSVGTGDYSSSSTAVTNTGGINSSCTSIGSLQNGNFETLPSAVSEETGTTRNVGKWHGYANSSNKSVAPRQFLILYESSSNYTPKIENWETTASENFIEIQRQVSGYAQTGTQSTGSYYDNYNVTAGNGSYWAELNADSMGALYQDVTTTPSTTLRWSILHRGRRFNVDDTMQVKIGSTSSVSAQTANKRFTPTNSLYAIPEYSTTSDSSYSVSSTISDQLGSGWRKYEGSYTVPAGQTTTRFQFEATSGTSLGNYLDNISFTPHIACPFTKTVKRGNSVSINVFTDSNLTTTEQSKGLDTAYIASTPTQTGLSGTVGFTSGARSFSYTAPNSTGTSVIKFKITNSYGDTSSAYATINVVDDLSQVAPTVIPVDPRATFIDLPGVDVVGDSSLNAFVCYRQSQSDGTDLASGHTLSIEVRTPGSAIVPQNSTTSELSIGGTHSVVENASSTVRITKSGGGRVLDANTSKYLRIRTSGDDDLSAGSCSNATAINQTTVVELKPVQLETTRRFNVTVD